MTAALLVHIIDFLFLPRFFMFFNVFYFAERFFYFFKKRALKISSKASRNTWNHRKK